MAAGGVVTSIITGVVNLGGRSVWQTGLSPVYHTDRLHLHGGVRHCVARVCQRQQRLVTY